MLHAATRLGAGRIVVLAMLAVYFAVFALLGGHSSWHRLGVPALSPSFADTRFFTTAWECVRDGYDVYVENPCDPFGARPMDYPRLWIAPAPLGIGEGATVPLAIILAVVFFAAAVAFAGRLTWWQGALFGAALCSPPVMLGVERGHPDLLLFSLLVAGIALLGTKGLGRGAGHGAFLLAAMLKLYPIVAAVALLRQKPRSWALAGTGAVVGLFGIYCLVTLDDVRMIQAQVAERPTVVYSFGVTVFAEDLRWKLSLLSEKGLIQALLLAGLAASAAAISFLKLRLAPSSRAGASESHRTGLWAGAAILLAVFAAGHNFDYRLSFALLALPALLVQSAAGDRLAAAAAGLVLVTLWGNGGLGGLWAWGDAAAYALLCVLAGILLGDALTALRRERAAAREARPRRTAAPVAD